MKWQLFIFRRTITDIVDGIDDKAYAMRGFRLLIYLC